MGPRQFLLPSPVAKSNSSGRERFVLLDLSKFLREDSSSWQIMPSLPSSIKLSSLPSPSLPQTSRRPQPHSRFMTIKPPRCCTLTKGGRTKRIGMNYAAADEKWLFCRKPASGYPQGLYQGDERLKPGGTVGYPAQPGLTWRNQFLLVTQPKQD